MDEEKYDLSFWELIKTVGWNVVQAYWVAPFAYIATIICNIFIAIIPILVTFIGAQILNEIIFLVNSGSKGASEKLLLLIAASAGLIFLSALLFNIYRFYSRKWRFFWDFEMWSKFIKKTSELDFQDVETSHFATFQHKAKEGVDWRCRDIGMQFTEIINLITTLLFALAFFLALNPIIILALIIPGILNLFVNKKYGKEIYSFWSMHGEIKTHSWYSQHALENKDVLREAKIYGFAGHIIKRFREAQQAFINDSIAKLKGRYRFNSMIAMLEGLIHAGIQIYLVFALLNGEFTVGIYVFYVSIVGRISDLLEKLEENTSGIIDDSRYAYDLKKYFALPSKLNINSKNKPKQKLELQPPTIEFKNVSFKYPSSENNILTNLSFKICNGEKVSLVGENGAGKTTIIKLLVRFYDVDEGEILINSINIKEIDLKSYYKLWGVLFQHFAKFWFTAKENIGVGNIEDIENIELIKQAAKESGAADYIENLPKKYETMLSNDFKDGVDPSGGQWQKIGIARGLFANPKFIVLDEPTSALDALAEAKVFTELKELAQDTTMLIVSHRFATVRNADKILVLDNGKITEQGSHEELMQNRGLYYKMFTTQSEGYK